MKCPHCGKRINAAKVLGAAGGAAGTGKAKARSSEQAKAAALQRWATKKKANVEMRDAPGAPSRKHSGQ